MDFAGGTVSSCLAPSLARMRAGFSAWACSTDARYSPSGDQSRSSQCLGESGHVRQFCRAESPRTRQLPARILSADCDAPVLLVSHAHRSSAGSVRDPANHLLQTECRGPRVLAVFSAPDVHESFCHQRSRVTCINTGRTGEGNHLKPAGRKTYKSTTARHLHNCSNCGDNRGSLVAARSFEAR